MANLTDFLEPQMMKKAEATVRTKPEFKEWKELREVCDSFLNQGIFSGGPFERLSQPELEIVEREESIMLGIWRDQKFLPAEMVNSALGERRDGEVVPYQRTMGSLASFSALPQTKLKNIVNAAEKLSFAIVPYEYVNQNSIVTKYAEGGQWEYSREIQAGFEEVNRLYSAVNTVEKIDLYILCPIGFYNPWQEVKDQHAKQTIFGGELSSVAMILGMLMPTQKNLYQMSRTNVENIESLRATMEANFAQVSGVLDNIQIQISWLQEAIKAVQYTASEAVHIADEALQKATLVEFELKCLLDPLVFAVPQGTDLHKSNVNARLLMCFGADMPLDFFLKRGLVRVLSDGYYDPIIKTYK